MPLATLQALVDDLVRDRDSVISTADRDQAIDTAVARYSGDRPRNVVEDVTSAGGGQALDLPAAWSADYSVLQAVEYPVGHIPARVIPVDQVQLYQAPASTQIILPVSVTAGEAVRLSFTSGHTVDGATDTTRARDAFAIASLAASILCGQLANHYSQDSDATIQADTVDHRAKAERFRSRERDYRATYFRELGITEQRNKPASAVADWNARDSHGGTRIFHPPRERIL